MNPSPRPIPKPSNDWLTTFKDKPKLRLPTNDERDARRGQIRGEIRVVEEALEKAKGSGHPESYLNEIRDKLAGLRKQFEDLDGRRK